MPLVCCQLHLSHLGNLTQDLHFAFLFCACNLHLPLITLVTIVFWVLAVLFGSPCIFSACNDCFVVFQIAFLLLISLRFFVFNLTFSLFFPTVLRKRLGHSWLKRRKQKETRLLELRERIKIK